MGIAALASDWRRRRLSPQLNPLASSAPISLFLPRPLKKPIPASEDDEESYDNEEDDGGEELAGLERGARGGIGLSPEQRLQQQQQQQQQGQRAPAPAATLAPREWAGLSGMPEPTRDRIEDALERFAQAQAQASGSAAAGPSAPSAAAGAALTVLILGTPGSGKSATANSLLNERVALVSPLQSEQGRPVLAARRPPAGSPQVTVAVVDTPALVASAELGDDDAGGGVSLAAANALGNALSGRPIDAVLFVDRLDGAPLGGAELALARAYSAAFGAGVWDKATLVLTHGRLACPPGGVPLDDFAAARAAELRALLRKAGASAATAALPALLADNGSRCPHNAAEEPVLLDNEPWLPAVWEAVVDAALAPSTADFPAGGAVIAPFVPDAAAARRAADPDRRRLWLIPLALAAQLALRWFVVERVIPEDGCRGDSEGPFSKSVARMNLQALREERKSGAARGGKGGKGAAAAGKKKGGGGGGGDAAALQRRKRAAAAAAAAKRKRAAAGAA